MNAHLLSREGGYRRAGVSTYIEQLLRHLWAAGGRRTSWTVFAQRDVTAEWLGAPPGTRVQHSVLPTHRPVPRIFWEQFCAPWHAARSVPDVLFCPLNVVPMFAPCPTVVTIHDLAFLRFPHHRGVKNEYLRAMARLSVRRASHVLTVSEFTRREVISLLGVAPEQVTAVPNGRDEQFRAYPREDLEAFRRAKGLPDRFLLCVGTLEPRKNILTLLRAYARVKSAIGIPLVLAGGRGWEFDATLRQLGELGLGGDVRLTGYVPGDELPLYYAAATAFVYPSLYEGFGLPPLEALSTGTPAVISDAASLREVVGDAGLCVPALDVDALAAALLRVVGDEPLRQDLRRLGLERSVEFSWRACAERTFEVLRHVAGRGGSRWRTARGHLPAFSGGPNARRAPVVARRPLRVLYLGHTAKLGGAELALWELLRAVDRDLVDPVVILFSDGPLVDRLRAAGIATRVLPLAASVVNARKDGLGVGTLARVDDVAACVAFVAQLARLISWHHPDLVHTNSLKAHVLGGLAARLAGTPILWHVRERIADDYLPRQAVRAIRRLTRSVPTRVVVNSRATARALFGAPGSGPTGDMRGGAERCEVVPDGADCDRFRPAPREAVDSARAAGRPVRVGLVGRISPFKGQDIFLRAAAEVLQVHSDVRFLIIGAALFGEDEYERQLVSLVRSLGLEPHVEFRGFQNDVPATLAELDVVVHASVLPEPFGQVVVEAMASGKPIVATAGGGILDILTDGRCGLLVPMGDAQALSRAISRLVADPGLRAALGEAGRRRAVEHFSVQQTARRIESVYQGFAAANGPGSPGVPRRWRHVREALAAVAGVVVACWDNASASAETIAYL